MNPRLFTRDYVFFPLLFAVWAWAMYAHHNGYPYLRLPPPSVTSPQPLGANLRKRDILRRSIAELRTLYARAKDPDKQMHIVHNIGIAYYDMHYLGNRERMLDSALAFFERSVSSAPPVAPFYYNLGRVYTSRGDHRNARTHYERALRINPNHILTLHNLGLVQFFEFNQPRASRTNLSRLLAIDSLLPVANYVLGEIAMREKNYRSALSHYRAEIEAFHKFPQRPDKLPISEGSLQYAASRSHLRLAILHSTHVIDRRKAQSHLHAYLKMEPNEDRKRESIAEMKRYWEMK